MFVTGLATMLIFFLGVWLLFSSMGRSRRKRVERKQARNRQKESVTQIEEERAQLRAENERLNERLATERDTTAAGTTAGTAGGAAGTAAADRTTSTDRTTSEGTTSGTATAGSAADRPQHVEGDRVVDHDTDLTGRDETASSTSGRHRDL